MMMMNVGLIGTGLMGLPLGERLLEFGYGLTVYNRTAQKTEALVTLGAKVATSPGVVFATSQVIVLMLTDGAAIEQLLFSGPVNFAGRTVLQMGTIGPGESQAIATRIETLGGQYLEAPVLGSIPEARSGKLIVMVGGEAELFEELLPLLKQLGPNPVLIGPVGSAATVKLALNQLIGSLTSGFALSLGLVQRSGIDPERFMAILRQSALYAPTFDKKLQRMVDHNYLNPNFPTKHLLKDMALFNATAAQQGLNVVGGQAIEAILAQAIAQNLADGDYAALYEAIVPQV
jgi:3-hydroxyisobutyrate dehydrogenase